MIEMGVLEPSGDATENLFWNFPNKFGELLVCSGRHVPRCIQPAPTLEINL